MVLTDDIPYADKLRHDKIEKGPVESQDLLYLIQYALPTQATTSFEMLFSLKNGYIPKSSAQVTIDREKRKLGLKEFSLYNSGVEDVLRGGQLEMLKLRFPEINSMDAKKDFAWGHEAFKIVKDNLDFFHRAGYVLSPESFRLAHYIVQVPDQFPGFFTRSYGQKILVRTESLLAGKPERKLVLHFTHDATDTDEVRGYQEIFNRVNSSPPVFL